MAKTIWCWLRIHHWHYWQSSYWRNYSMRGSKTFFHRECLYCGKQEDLGWRYGAGSRQKDEPRLMNG